MAQNGDGYQFLLFLGSILLLGLATDFLGRRTFLPRVTLLLMFGILIGPYVFKLVPVFFVEQFELIAQMTLVMVGFMLGGTLTFESLKEKGKLIATLSILAATLTAVIVSSILLLFKVPLAVAILLGSIAAATDGTAILELIEESEFCSAFSQNLLSVVALDDAWGMILFGIGLTLASVLSQAEVGTTGWLLGFSHVGGGIVLGILIGLPAAYLTGRVHPGQPMMTEALGLIFLCGGLAIWLNVSYLIASMVMGSMVANFASHHQYPFDAIEGIEWPMFVIFFVLAGASLDVSALSSIGFIGLIYLFARVVGKMAGGWTAAVIGQADVHTKRWIGLAMLPQASAALGMALVAANQFPQYSQILLTTIVASTIIFEIIGTITARIALQRAQ
ncbi:MAG TPA: sodium:proton antiporter [Gammaproteobacteria bacterium]|nr:sodium:proton antiporter [Gammaproteobacteria bacterium]